MPPSDDYGDFDDDTELIAAGTQAEEEFEQSPRPAKRRRLSTRTIDTTEPYACCDNDTGKDNDGPCEPSRCFTHATTQQTAATEDDEIEDDPGYYFPGELGDVPPDQKLSKYKIHVPSKPMSMQNRLVSQMPPPNSNPAAIRGPIWMKPPKHTMAPPSSVLNGMLYGSAGAVDVTGKRQDMVGQKKTSGLHTNGLQRRSSAETVMTTTGSANNAARSAKEPIEDDAALAARLQAHEDGRAMPKTLVKSRMPFSKTPSFHTLDLTEPHPELEDLPSDAFSSSPEKKGDDAVYISSSQPTAQAVSGRNKLRGPQTGLKQMTIFGAPTTQDMTASQQVKKKHAWPLASRQEPPTHHELDEEPMKSWVYPTNLGTIRDYQYNIVSRGLFHNLLVALPTGLGKTFIAATIMLNWYRWTKNAQLIFMAPTKPLIAQQMDACYNIVGIPRRDTVLMTGETSPGLRADEWLEKRVFFMTPQTVINDLKTGIADPKKIVLLVVDEAHKATGGYAYTEVIAFLRRFNESFRVLALTATPGSTVEKVQELINNLSISRIELRTEASLDIRQYTHEKQTETEVFEYSMEQSLIMGLVSKALRPVLEKLSTQNAYWSRDPMQLTAFGLTQSRGRWAQSDAGRKAPMSIKGMINSIFTVLSSLAHSIGLLKNHGITPFYSGMLEFQRIIDSGQSKGKYAMQIAHDEHFVKMMGTVRTWTNNPDFIGHPKLEYLRSVVLNHFLDAAEGHAARGDVPPSATRVMVFASYRDSTEEIARVLKRNEPMIRPHVFVGQAASKSSEGMDQKRQNAVIQDFKNGKYNTLVATSIGEEGLDIGDVDLIVCYDASASPIRMLQRIGRTGRKRVGRVQLLLMKGKEEADYAKAQDNYSFIQKSIADTGKYTFCEDRSPRILPKDKQPVVDKRVVEIPLHNSQAVDLDERKRKGVGRGRAKRPPKKFRMPDNVRTGFVKASKLGESDNEDEEDLPALRNTKAKKTPAKRTSAKKSPVEPEPEPAQLPFLEDVLLTDAQERELERRYQQIPDSENGVPPIVSAPNVNACPDALRSLRPTKYVRHGRATQTIAEIMHRVHAINDNTIEELKENLHLSDIDDVTQLRRLASIEPEVSEPELPSIHPVVKPKKPRGRPRKQAQSKAKRLPIRKNSSDMEGSDSSPEPTPAEMRIATQGIDLGSEDTEGEEAEAEADNELADFLVRSDQLISQEQDEIESSLPSLTAQKTSRRRRIFVDESDE